MKQYIVTTDSKTPDFYKNEMESFAINAKSIKDAAKKGRQLAKSENQRFIRVRVKK